MTRTTEYLKQLHRLAQKAGEAIYDRVFMAQQVLADDVWLREHHKGRYDLGVSALEGTCFPELSAAFSLDRLLTLLGAFPDREFWREKKWNLTLLWACYQARVKNEGPKTPPGQKKNQPQQKQESEEPETPVSEFQHQLDRTTHLLAQQETELTRLRRENEELRQRVATLENQLSEMEKQLKNQEELQVA